MTQQIRLLSVGIADYSRTDHSSILPSLNDSLGLYGAISKVTGNNFDSSHSVHATDITSETFISLLNFILGQSSENQFILVVYFSGHATVDQHSLTLHFVNSRDGRYGIVTTAELDEIFRRFKRPEVVLILDCCYSGLAGTLSKSINPFFPTKTTIISSSNPFEASLYQPEQSVFTKALIETLYYLDQNGEQISVSGLYKGIATNLSQNSYQHPKIFIREGEADVVLTTPDPPLSGGDSNAVSLFVKSLSTSCASDREALWYALDEYKENIAVEVLHNVIDSSIYEPLWLIRRAMGSAMAGLTRLQSKKRELYFKYCTSTQWMNVCVGIIGTRYNLKDSATAQLLFDILLSTQSMDSRWLAFLYLADEYQLQLLNRIDLIETVMLGSTSWGMCEIWERCVSTSLEDFILLVAATEALLQRCNSGEVLNDLLSHIFLMRQDIYDKLSPKYKANHAKAIFDDEIMLKYAKNGMRGPLIRAGASKWIDSKLYGVWRGQVQNSIASMLHDLPPNKVQSFLSSASLLPSVSKRMAIFQGLRGSIDLPLSYLDSLTWGFQDSHPWVRREAFEWLIHAGIPTKYPNYSNKIIESALLHSDREFYPGVIDLVHSFIIAAKFLDLKKEIIDERLNFISATFSKSEKIAIERSLKKELHLYNFV